ncbi:DUF7666 domain-containing protein [Alistipes putredinis]|uniref:DUF7666 domain-containing protein n=1 Tax=Alistipes putredinis TaxID=28117 RepID=UPI003C6BF20B
MAIKSYKGFDKNLRCRDFQYEIGGIYEMDGKIKMCNRGFHACESPFDVFDYYTMIDSRFCEVEQDGNISKEDRRTKICSSKIKIKLELKLADMINLGVEWLKEITSPEKIKTSIKDNSSGNYAQIGSSGDGDKIGSSGYGAKIGSSGYNAKIGSSGDGAKIGSSGYGAQIGSSGNGAQIGSSGNDAKISSSGNNAQIGSSGDGAKIGSSGYGAKIGSSGNNAQIGSSGNNAQIGSSGYNAQIGSSGNDAKISSSGYGAKIDSTGEDCVIMCAGINSVAKASKGSWVTLSEWSYSEEKQRYIPIYVKTEFVDGEKIKADTYYSLKGGVFVEWIND